MFKNTTKLLISNIPTVWKLFVYKFIVLLIVVGLFCATLGYLNSLGTFTEFKTALVAFLNATNFATTPAVFMGTAGTLLTAFFAFVVNLCAVYPGIFIYLFVVFAVILPYLWHLGDIATSEVAFGFMSSQTKYGFTSSFIRNLNRENAYSWCVTLLFFPFNALFLAGVVGLILMAGVGGIGAVLAPALLVLWTILYFSIRIAVFSSWAGAITTRNSTTWHGLTNAVSAVTRNFLKVWTFALVFVFIFTMFVILTGIIGCVIILPLFCFIITVYGLVVFFEHNGMRYYVDFDTIIKPKKLEQTDKLSKLKYLI